MVRKSAPFLDESFVGCVTFGSACTHMIMDFLVPYTFASSFRSSLHSHIPMKINAFHCISECCRSFDRHCQIFTHLQLFCAHKKHKYSLSTYHTNFPRRFHDDLDLNIIILKTIKTYLEVHWLIRTSISLTSSNNLIDSHVAKYGSANKRLLVNSLLSHMICQCKYMTIKRFQTKNKVKHVTWNICFSEYLYFIWLFFFVPS